MSSGPATEPAEGSVDLSIEGAIATITFNRPTKHNAMSMKMWQAVPQRCAEALDHAEVRAVVLRGAGGKSFVAGADISQFSTSRSGDSAGDYNAAVAEAYQTLMDMPLPTIAAITGLCVGGGLAMALCADFRIATVDSRFGLPPAKLGIGYPQGGVDGLVSVVGPAVAKRMLFTGDLFSSDQALAWGLIEEAHAREAFDSALGTIVSTVTVRAPLSIRAAKLSVAASVHPSPEARSAALAAIAACGASADYVEGVAAFTERRDPMFEGK